jgi:hypothetical protein
MQAFKILGLLLLAGVLAIVALVLLKVTPRIQPAIAPVISNFQECAAAGNPVMESYPRQCATKDGRTFIEDVAPVESATSTQPTAECVTAGCSGQLCVAAADASTIVTTCEFKAEYACYANATCEKQSDGKCGWTQTTELKSCLANPPAIQSGGNLE